MQFGAIEIPIGVPAADRTLALLARIDERAQEVAKHIGGLVPPGTPPAVEKVGEAAEGLSHKLTHLGVSGSFAFTNLATGSEQGLTRVAHSLAMLGGAFGGIGLVVSTFVAVAGEKLLQFWHKAQEEADKAAKANQKFLDSVGEAKNLPAAAARQVQLFSGSQYTTEADPTLAAGIRRGGIQQLLHDTADLTAKTAAAKKAMEEFQGGKQGSEARKLKKDYEELNDKLQETIRLELALSQAFEKTSRLTGALTKEAVHKQSSEAVDATRREKLEESHRLMQAEAKDNSDKLIAIADWWVGEMEKEYGKDSKQYNEALVEKVSADEAAEQKRKADQTKAIAFVQQYDEAVHQLDVARAQDHYDKQIAIARTWVDRMRLLYGLNSEQYLKALTEQEKIQQAHDAKVKAEAARLAQQTSSLISSALSGITAGGPDGIWGAIGDAILKGLGQIFIQIGEKMIEASAIFTSLAAWLADPFAPGAGVGMALGGAALIALGSLMGASGGGHGHGGSSTSHGYGSSFSYGQAVVSTITPRYMPNTAGVTAKAPVTVNATFIGKRDPVAGRELLEMIAIAQQRGSTAG